MTLCQVITNFHFCIWGVNPGSPKATLPLKCILLCLAPYIENCEVIRWCHILCRKQLSDGRLIVRTSCLICVSADDKCTTYSLIPKSRGCSSPIPISLIHIIVDMVLHTFWVISKFSIPSQLNFGSVLLETVGV